MSIRFLLPLVLLMGCFINEMQAQRVGIGTTSPDSSAILDIQDLTKGLLIPRTDTANVNNPALGLMVFQPSDSLFYYFDGNTWERFANESIISDSDGDTKIVMEKTEDDDVLRFYRGGIEVMRMDSFTLEFLNSGQSVFIGEGAGKNDNLYINSNTFIGYKAGHFNTFGNMNTFIGSEAGRQNSTGRYNTFLGTEAGRQNSTGRENTFVGSHTGANNSTGRYNTFLGSYAGLTNTNGANNTLIGYYAGLNINDGG